MDETLDWGDLEQLRIPDRVAGAGQGHRPPPSDAELACEHGAAGVIVSNLPDVSSTGRSPRSTPCRRWSRPSDDRVEVLVDGGVRRGTDVARALALGARAVLAGRAPLWGLAARGEQGALEVLDLAARGALQRAAPVRRRLGGRRCRATSSSWPERRSAPRTVRLGRCPDHGRVSACPLTHATSPTRARRRAESRDSRAFRAPSMLGSDPKNGRTGVRPRQFGRRPSAAASPDHPPLVLERRHRRDRTAGRSRARTPASAARRDPPA